MPLGGNRGQSPKGRLPVTRRGAMLLGLFVTRLRGIYFATFTIAFGQLFYFVAFQFNELTGGDDGLRGFSRQPIELGPLRFDVVPSISYWSSEFSTDELDRLADRADQLPPSMVSMPQPAVQPPAICEAEVEVPPIIEVSTRFFTWTKAPPPVT